MDTFSQLRQFPLFGHFDDESVRQVIGASFVENHSSGSKVYRESDPSFALYIILRGAVRIERYTPFNPYHLGSFIRGEFFGDRDFVHRSGRGADAVTDADSELLMLDPDLLATQCERRQPFELALYWALWKSLSANLRKANDRMATFFSESDSRQTTGPPAADRGQAARFRVDMASKRSVFQEQKLSPMEINFLASLSKEERLKPGQVIFSEGEPGDKMYVVLDGEVMISKLIPGVGEEALAFLARGDYFGEMALIDRLPRSAEAKAHSEGALVLSIPRDVLEGILNIQKVSSVRLLRLLSSLVAHRLRESDDRLVGWHVLAAGQSGG
ncbi:MAG: cyclic nucleotide-binding domain-containing protein [Thermoanaerobaculia bacterium]